MPERDSIDAPGVSSVQGLALGLDGEPVEGLRVSLVAETFWSWGETGGAGTFEIHLPEGSSGPSVLSIHAGGAGDCGWLGYHGPDGITALRTQATRVEISDGNVTGIEVRLPVGEDDLCPGQRKVTGIVLGPDGEPLEGIGLWAWQGAATNSGYGETGADGVFDIGVPSGSFTLDVYAVSGECSFVGWYDGAGSITSSRSQAAKVVVGGISVEGIVIHLPENPGELPRIDHCA